MSKRIVPNDGQLKLAVGIPAYGDSLTAHHARMWTEFGATLSGSTQRFALVMFSTIDVNPIDRARNMLLAQAMMAGADWLFTIDADTWVEGVASHEDAGTMILRMIADAERREAWMVGAPVRRREGFETKTEHMVYNTKKIVDDPNKPQYEHTPIDYHMMPRALLPVDALATACVALSCARIATCDDLFFAFDPSLGLSEDLNFCRMVKERGGTIYADRRVRTGHKSRPFALYSGDLEQPTVH